MTSPRKGLKIVRDVVQSVAVDVVDYVATRDRPISLTPDMLRVGNPPVGCSDPVPLRAILIGPDGDSTDAESVGGYDAGLKTCRTATRKTFGALIPRHQTWLECGDVWRTPTSELVTDHLSAPALGKTRSRAVPEPRHPGLGSVFDSAADNAGNGASVLRNHSAHCTGGSGTTGMVADRLGRNAILCELSADYSEQAVERVSGDSPMFAEVEVA